MEVASSHPKVEALVVSYPSGYLFERKAVSHVDVPRPTNVAAVEATVLMILVKRSDAECRVHTDSPSTGSSGTNDVPTIAM